MEAPAPYYAAGAGAQGPRNVAVPLAAWLRRLGFSVREHGGAAPTGLEATWAFGPHAVYAVSYAFDAASGGLLRISRNRHQLQVAGADVRRLREARYLLLSCRDYAADREAALAAGALQPA